MDTADKKYYVRLKSGKVEVCKEVYELFYSMRRKEAYQTERDISHGLLYYDAWDSDRVNGIEYIPDEHSSTEAEVFKKLENQEFWKCIDKVGDKYNICRLVAMGKTEEEIAEIAGISQQAVNKAKQKLFKKLKNIFEKKL